jgi:para-aminobenzoate synthetase component I
MRKFIPLSGCSPDFENALLAWASAKEVTCVLKSNRELYPTVDAYSSFDSCIAVESLEETGTASAGFAALKEFHERTKDWLFGFLSYDLKNELEDLSSLNNDVLQFRLFHFFRPRYIFMNIQGSWKLGYDDQYDNESIAAVLVAEINSLPASGEESGVEAAVLQRVSRELYTRNVAAINEHIQRGDVYEMNYCVEFYSAEARIQPEAVYSRLNALSPMPFSCFYKNRDQFLSCASPERFIAKRGRKIISQPIKGTAPRGRTMQEDVQIRQGLLMDEKERSENVMIVDLVRNDLSRTAARNSVRVEELFGIHTFRQLHQMISTVVSDMREDVHWTDVIRAAFPMGSMTGAPKIRAMELIEKFESSKRGLYSGTVGYVTPEGDFDFNVVIRSILYNRAVSYLSFMVGSAITINSDAAKEYDECLLKARAMMQALGNEQFEKAG